MAKAVLAGKFDPIHEGNILFAQTVLEQFSLEQLYFLPLNNEHTASLEDRYNMIALALEPYEGLELLKLPLDPDYNSIAKEVNNKLGEDVVWVMGASKMESLLSKKELFGDFLHDNSFIVGLLTEDDGEILIPWTTQEMMEVEFLPSPLSTVSSGKIRQAVSSGEQAKGLNDDVKRYISEHGLYTG